MNLISLLVAIAILIATLTVLHRRFNMGLPAAVGISLLVAVVAVLVPGGLVGLVLRAAWLVACLTLAFTPRRRSTESAPSNSTRVLATADPPMVPLPQPTSATPAATRTPLSRDAQWTAAAAIISALIGAIATLLAALRG